MKREILECDFCHFVAEPTSWGDWRRAVQRNEYSPAYDICPACWNKTTQLLGMMKKARDEKPYEATGIT